MKKSLLTLVSVMLTTMSALAQWVDPVPEFTSPSFDGTPQFLYNVEAKGFFCGGNDWNTRASISHTFGDSIYFQPVTEAEGKYYFRCFPSVAKKGFFFFVSANNWDASWVDAPNNGKFNETLAESDAYPGVDKWNLAVQPNGSYKIYNTTELVEVPDLDPEKEHQGYYGIAQIFWGGQPDTDTRVWFYDDSRTFTTTNDEGEEIIRPAFEGLFYDEWRFVSQEAYADWFAKKEIYDAAVALKKAIDDTKAAYDGIDVTDAEGVYNNYASTAEELNKARTELIPADIEAYVNGQIDKASLDNPVDVSSRIGYIEDLNAIAAGNGSLPKNGWVTTKTDGNFHINTWSTEGNSDGTNMTTPFIEYWKAKGNLLDNQKFYRDPAKDAFLGEIPAGAYKITANIRIYNESGAEYVDGAYLFANINRNSLTKPTAEGEIPTQANAIEGATYSNYNGMLLYWKDGFETYAIVPEANSLIFGVQTQDVNFNWVASKDFKVAYLGSSYESLDYVRQNTDLLADAYDEGVVAQKSLVGEYNAAVASYSAATDAASIISAYAKIAELLDSVSNNIAAYKAYADRLEFISNYMGNEGATLEGDEVDLLTDYLDGDEGPCDEYPNGYSHYILDQLTLNTPEIKAELEFLNQLFNSALENGMSEGTDVTNLLVNPSFADGFKGWTSSTGGNVAGNIGFGTVEVFGGVVDCQQTVKAKPGIYAISVKAFERPGGNGEYTGTEDAKVFVFMNKFKNPVMNIVGDALNPDEAVNKTNCFIDNGGTAIGTWPLDYALPATIEGKEGYYVPNSMEGASYAFGADRYINTCYGLVEEGEDMTIGVTSNGVSVHWVLWADFKLTYMGKNADAVAAILEAKLDEYSTYVSDQSDNDMINSAEKTLADDAIDNAEGALQSGDADKMWDALIAINNAYTHTQEHVAIMTELKDNIDNLSNTLNEYAETASAEAKQKANDILTTPYDDLTNEELSALSANAKDAIAQLKIPATQEASDENPVDFTEVIVNHDIEQGATVGWSYTKNGGNGPNLDAGIDGKSVEFWNGTASNLQFNFYQEIAHLPAGTYELTVTASNSLNGQEDPGNPGRAFLYVATYTTESSDSTWFSSSPVEIQTEGCTEKYADYSVIFSVEEGQLVTIGVKTSGTMTARWFVCDNFKLKYFGTESQHEDSENPMSVDGVEVAEGAQIVAIYTVSGAPVATLQKGLNIVKYADGSVKKIFVK